MGQEQPAAADEVGGMGLPVVVGGTVEVDVVVIAAALETELAAGGATDGVDELCAWAELVVSAGEPDVVGEAVGQLLCAAADALVPAAPAGSARVVQMSAVAATATVSADRSNRIVTPRDHELEPRKLAPKPDTAKTW